MVYQDPTGALNPRQTIYDSVAEGLRIHRVPGDEQALGRAALPGQGSDRRSGSSCGSRTSSPGGQRQRVVIAGALALEPRVIVADEPVSNLDASVRGEILRLLLDLRRTSAITILIVTHDLGLAWTVADRVAVMYLGRIVEVGPTRDVLTEPEHPYTRALLDVVPEGEATARTGDCSPASPRTPRTSRADVASTRGARRWPTGWPAHAGVDEACRVDDPALETLAPGHLAACHLATARSAGRVP